jgi:hypothetical protein
MDQVSKYTGKRTETDTREVLTEEERRKEKFLS